MTDSTESSGFSDALAEIFIDNRLIFLAAVVLITVAFGYFAYQIDIETRFQDLLPRHPFMETHNKFKDNFGGANVVSILLEYEGKGDIFQRPILKKIQTVTQDLRKVDGVNPGTIMSLASQRLEEVQATAYQIKTAPVMWPEVPKTDEAIQELRQTVRSNPQIYGVYVSRDMKSARITTDFYTHLLDPVKVFNQIRDLNQRVESENVELSAVGNPMLYGWVEYYLTQTLTLVVVSIAIVGLVIVLFTGTILGSLIPLICTFVSAIWALGFSQIIGLHFDPLVVVIAFLIMARVVSASIQSLMRYMRELREGKVSSPVEAAKNTLGSKWTPGALAVLTDAGAFLIVYLTPIPILQKIALIGFIWLITIPITSIALTSVLLCTFGNVNEKSIFPVALGRQLDPISDFCEMLSYTKWRYTILVVTALILLVAGYYATGITVGNAKPGSSILWPSSNYNQTVEKLNHGFLGSNQMFVVFSGEKPDTLKYPSVLNTMLKFQRFAEHQPQIGGSLSLADVLPAVNRALNEGDPRFAQLGKSSTTNGELLYFFRDSPEALKGIADPKLQNGAVNLFFTDHKGETIRTAIDRIQAFIQANPMEKADYELAGGRIGVMAATNAVIKATELQSISLALLLALVLCALTYGAYLAGLYLIIPLIVANAVTYGYMAYMDIGLNINSVPVAALGIGLGIDYAIYVADRMRSGYRETGDLRSAIHQSLYGAGQSVLITVIVLAVSIIPFLFSSLRFQAEMALLIALWMAIAAMGAVLVVPSLVAVFEPEFIVGSQAERTETQTAPETST